jgi:hypothetical protein
VPLANRGNALGRDLNITIVKAQEVSQAKAEEVVPSLLAAGYAPIELTYALGVDADGAIWIAASAGVSNSDDPHRSGSLHSCKCGVLLPVVLPGGITPRGVSRTWRPVSLRRARPEPNVDGPDAGQGDGLNEDVVDHAEPAPSPARSPSQLTARKRVKAVAVDVVQVMPHHL